jgi:hypothetical protein
VEGTRCAIGVTLTEANFARENNVLRLENTIFWDENAEAVET